MNILITGCAGFIGSNLAAKLLASNYVVTGIDNFYNNYPLAFKKAHIAPLLTNRSFTFYNQSILDTESIETVLKKTKPEVVVHLAALTGVRASLAHTDLYERVNVYGTQLVYETAARNNVKKFIFASSSSVYGNHKNIAFSEHLALAPRSPYAKTKKEAEDLLVKLNKEHHLPFVILRFFSVYGPHGRPDMAPYLFTQAALSNRPIPFYGDGKSARDYTFIDDVTNAIDKAIHSKSDGEIFNIGNSHPVKLNELVSIVEEFTHKKILLEYKPFNEIESYITFADASKARELLDWLPKTTFSDGMKIFTKWYKENRITQI